jgi:hypothetical protein
MREAGLYPPGPEHLFWKYWLERNDWPGPRSYVLTDGTRLLAHLGVVPASCRLASRTLRIASVVDWAARPSEAGAGVRLMRHVASLADALLAIDPNPPASKVIRLMGYRPHGLATGYVRTLFPLRLLRGSGGPAWRLLPRLVRSAVWSLAAPRSGDDRWQARQVAADQIDRIASVLPRSRQGLTVLERAPPQLRYLLDCPTAPIELYTVEEAGHPRGYFVLAFVPGQARLVDCWVESTDPSAWCALIQCAVGRAKQDGEVAELAAWASDPLLAQCLMESGFHARRSAPIYLRTDNESLIAACALRVQMVDSDAAYLHSGGRELWA